MSKYGIEYAVFAERAADGTYSNGRYLSPVAAYNGTPNVVSGSDYGDNHSLDAEAFVAGGTLSVEFNRDQDDIYVFLLGHEQAQSGEIAYNSDDEAPLVGTGAIGRSNGKNRKYTTVFYKEVQFHEPNDENVTRNNSIQHNHLTLEGEILIPEDGEWKLRKQFDTFAAAKAYLDNLVGISE